MHRLPALLAFAISTCCLVAKSQEVKPFINLVSGQCTAVKAGDELHLDVNHDGWLPSAIHFAIPNFKSSTAPELKPRVEAQRISQGENSSSQTYKIQVMEFASSGEYHFDYEKRVFVGGGGKRKGTMKTFPADAAAQLQRYCFTVR